MGDDWVLTINGTALKESSTPPQCVPHLLPLRERRECDAVAAVAFAQRETHRGFTSSLPPKGYKGPIDIPFYSDDYGYGRFSVTEDPGNTSPVNLNHPFSALHLTTDFLQDDESLRHSFWYAIKRSKEPWRDAL